MPQQRHLFQCLVASVGIGSLASSAGAADLVVSSIEVNQAVQYGTTKLFGNNVTWIRAKIGVKNAVGAVQNVDAILHMFVNGVEVPGGPVYSLNGPIAAPLNPDSGNINNTINFAVIPPVSGDVDFTVEVNPGHVVVEQSYANNTLSANNKNFECRKTVEIAYVPINYTPGGGLPPANLIEPGIGDGFVRAIYHPNEWNYHKSPLPPLLWSTSINSSDFNLLNTLHDIRVNQIPAAGYPQPEFVYGWLPGNPFSGNGETISVPGDVAFGNTDPTRHQRTFAHELGHAFGLFHDNQTINTIGVDTEHDLQDTQSLDQLFPATKNDIMVAGLLTNQAFIWQNSYNTVHSDSRMACGAADAPDGGIASGMTPVLRLSGVITNATKAVALDPVTRIALAQPTANDPLGDLVVKPIGADGRVLASIMVRSNTNPELCSEYQNGQPALNPRSSLWVAIPETIDGRPIQSISVSERATGRVLASVSRSPHAPVISIPQVAAVGLQGFIAPGNNLQGVLQVSWSGQDEDGDQLTYNLLYSPDDGMTWLPIMVNRPDASFAFSTTDIPGSRGGRGKFKVVATDGMNVAEAETPVYALADSNPPDTYLISPNNNDTYPQLAPVAFHAASWDLEDKMLSGGQITWTSSIDGPIGTGQLFINKNLSPGTHTITVTGKDTTGTSSSKQISLTISPRVVVSPDCNANGVLDSIDISSGSSSDANANGVPDDCESLCVADINGSGVVDVDDLFAVINAWGPCPVPANCPADIGSPHDGTVDVDDLFAVINAWGACP